MKLKSEKGFTGVDITIALILILLFMSLISIIFFNITKTSKGMDRKSEATYYATTIIEDIKGKDYDDVKITSSEQSPWVNVKDYNYLNNKGKINIDVEDGYTCTINIANHYKEGSTNDLVKVVNVKVQYKVAGSIEEINLSTTLVREF